MIGLTPSSSGRLVLPPPVPLARLLNGSARSLPPVLRRMRELRHASTPDELAFLVDEIWGGEADLLAAAASASASPSSSSSAAASYGLSRLQPGDAVVDVGANVGLSAIYAAERVRVSAADLAAGKRAGVVVALEPLPRTHAALAANIATYLAAVAEHEREERRGEGREPDEHQEERDGSSSSSSRSSSSRSSNNENNNNNNNSNSAFPSLVGVDVALLPVAAVAPGQPGTVELTTWPRAAGWATLCSSAEDDAAVERDMLVFLRSHARAVADGKAAAPAPGSRSLARAGAALAASPRLGWLFDALASAYVRRVLLAGREAVACEARTLSAVLRERLPPGREVALLKVDVERAELGVLAGVGEEDWPRIRRVVVEASATVAPSSASASASASASSAAAAAGGAGADNKNNDDGGGDNLAAVVRLLREAGGFRSVEVAQAPALAGTSLFVVAAER